MRFYFDFLSPYAYLGWTQVHAVAARHGRVVEPVPVLLAALLNAWGHKGPAEIAPKREYMFKHVVRIAHDLGQQLRTPPSVPFNPLLALRIASIPLDAAERHIVVQTLWSLAWREGVGVTDPEVVRRGLDTARLDGASLIARANSDEIKAALRSQTDAALAAGVFGVPTVEVDGELFWGQDALPHVERFLAGSDPVTPELRAEFARIPVGANRLG